MTEPLLFPEFLYGDLSPTQRKVKAETKKWGKRYAKSGDFPEPKLIPVPPGSIVFWERMALDLMKWGGSTEKDPEWEKVCLRAGRHVPRWHLHHLDLFMYEIPRPDGDDHLKIRARLWETYEAFVCRYPWGAVAFAIAPPLYNTIAVASRRIDALLSFWEPLDTIRYVGHDLYPVSLTDFVLSRYKGTLLAWVDSPNGDVRVDLRTAYATMQKASADEIQSRMARYAAWFIETWPHLKHRDWLKSPGLVQRAAEKIRRKDQDRFEELLTGPALGSLISGLDDRYPDEEPI
jgi:hypothetical protein